MSTSHFDQQLPKWSERKHTILQQYLETFCVALSRRSPRTPIWYVDGYAGAGVYRDPSNPSDPGKPGSPVLAAQITKNLSYNIRCLNIEEDPVNFASLVQSTASFTHITNINGDFTQIIDLVLRETRDCPALFFLDSFGTKELPMEGVVDKIAQRSQPTDILLRYATDAVRRLAGSYENDPVRRSANEINLNKWFRGRLWQDIIRQNPSGPARDNALLDYYKQQITSISNGRIRYAQDYHIKAIDNSIKYHMVFATGNRLGIKIMSDILYKLDKQFSEENETHQRLVQPYQQTNMFLEVPPTPELQFEQHLLSIQLTILEIGRQSPDWSFEELYYELILKRNWFAKLSEKDFRDACKELHKNGQIKRLTDGRAWNKDTRLHIELE